MRRNLLHNCVVHPLIGVIYLLADTLDLLGFVGAHHELEALGDKIHADPRWGP